ncbi:MAG: sugar ABC transporter permease [Spirochaetaceae bacterium]|jgi:multiple sugar transport system permease protein|nr:sugar ABC transporter permease [Spirochaetaceae bacterium]
MKKTQAALRQVGKCGRKKYQEWLWALLFVGPTVFGIYLFFIWPMVDSVYISLTRWNHLSKPIFIGLANYVQLFRDPQVLKEFLNTLFFVGTIVPVMVVGSLLLANALNTKTPLTGFLRTAFFLPYMLLPVVTATVWRVMFNTRYGLINVVLGGLGLPQPAWLMGEYSVRMVIMVVSLWAGIGYYGIILLAGLQNIPRQYYEACELDGGRAWHKFLHITVPLVTPQLFFVVMITIISVFQLFDFIFIFGKGIPAVKESIRTMAFGIYERGFTYLDMGYASAEAIVFCVLILAVTVVQNYGQKKWVHYS